MRHLPLGLLLSILALFATPAVQASDCPRIVSQSPYLSIALDWLGRGDCIVGVSRYDKRELPRTGGVMDPDASAIAALKPDLVISSTLTPAERLAQVTPANARSLRLGGSRSVADTERMMAELAAVSDAPSGTERAKAFSRSLHEKLGAMGGSGRRILLLSACSTLPYSYGRNTLLGDLVGQAGFTLADEAEGIRHIRSGEAFDNVPALVEATKPDIVVNFLTTSGAQCDARLGALPVTLVMLSGDNFFYPGPRLLEGLDELKDALK